MRLRLLLLGLAPFLVALPVFLIAISWVANSKADALLTSNMRGHLAGTRTYLDQIKLDASNRVRQLVRSERIVNMVREGTNTNVLNTELLDAARSSSLDYLIIATENGEVVASSAGVPEGTVLPMSYVIRQATIGVATASFERFPAQDLSVFSPDLPQRARLRRSDGGGELDVSGLVVHAAVHFPLRANMADAVLIGGIMLNQNAPLVDHLRDIIFPIGTLPDDTEGLTGLHTAELSIAMSRHQRLRDEQLLGLAVDPAISEQVLRRGEPWIGRLSLGDSTYFTGFEALISGDGQRIGMISAAFPHEPYQRLTWLIVATVGTILALTMLGISALFLRTGNSLTARLRHIGDTMKAVESGQRHVRTGANGPDDELGQLSHNFDELLDTIDEQDRLQKAVQQRLAEEASRRRALFHSERDGVVILDSEGRIFEANPSASDMLGYSLGELSGIEAFGWFKDFPPKHIREQMRRIGTESRLFEREIVRKDGTTFHAEISASRAEWDSHTFVLVLMRDITTRKLAERELAQRTAALIKSESRARAIMTTSMDAIVVMNNDKQIVECNPAAEYLFGRNLQTLMQLHIHEVLRLGLAKPNQIAETTPVPPWKPGRLEGMVTHPDGQEIPVEISLGELEDGTRPLWVANIHDISERKAAEREMHRLATTDGLTGLANRRSWTQGARKMVAQAQRYGHPVALLWIDVDKFKQINDTFGHPGGDVALRELAKVLSINLRETDLLGRMGGEEFAVIMPETSETGVELMGQRLLQAVRDCVVMFEGKRIPMTISLGAAVMIDAQRETLEELTRRSDDALYKAKETGRNRLCLSEPWMPAN